MKKLVVVLFIPLLLLGGCEKKSDVSPGAKAVIETIMTCPNTDLFDPEDIVAIGSGVPIKEIDKEKRRTKEILMDKCWEDALGEYFGYKQLEKFRTSGQAYELLYRYSLEGKKTAVKQMTPIERDKYFEKVSVTLLIDDIDEQQVSIKFEYDNDGLIKEVSVSGDFEAK